jgi:hypothetical protein
MHQDDRNLEILYFHNKEIISMLKSSINKESFYETIVEFNTLDFLCFSESLL